MKEREDTGCVLLVAVLFFGGLALVAWASGVFAMFSAEERAAIAAFALVYGVAACVLDRNVRGYLDALARGLALRRAARRERRVARSKRVRGGLPRPRVAPDRGVS